MSPLVRVVVATPLDETLCRLIENAEPRIELVRKQSLLPPMRWPADFAVCPSFPSQRARGSIPSTTSSTQRISSTAYPMSTLQRSLGRCGPTHACVGCRSWRLAGAVR